MASYQPDKAQVTARQEEGCPEPYRQFRFEDGTDDATTMRRVYLQLMALKEDHERSLDTLKQCMSLMRKIPAVARQLDPAVDALQKRKTLTSDDVDCPKDVSIEPFKKGVLDEIEEELWTKKDSIELEKEQAYSAVTEKQCNKPDPYETHETVGDTGFAEASNFSTAGQSKPSLPTNPMTTPVQEGQKVGGRVVEVQPAIAEVDEACAGDETGEDEVSEADVAQSDLKLSANACDPPCAVTGNCSRKEETSEDQVSESSELENSEETSSEISEEKDADRNTENEVVCSVGREQLLSLDKVCVGGLSRTHKEPPRLSLPCDSAIKSSTTGSDSRSGSQSLSACPSGGVGQNCLRPLSLQPVPRVKCHLPAASVEKYQNKQSLDTYTYRERGSLRMAIKFPNALQCGNTESVSKECQEAGSGKVVPDVDVLHSDIPPDCSGKDTDGEQSQENHVAKLENEDGDICSGEVFTDEDNVNTVCTANPATCTSTGFDDVLNTGDKKLSDVSRTDIVLPELSASPRKAIDSASFTGTIDCGGEANEKQVYLHALPASPGSVGEHVPGTPEGNFEPRNRQGNQGENIVKAEQEARVDATSASTLATPKPTGSASPKPPFPALPAFHPALFQQMMRCRLPQRSSAQASNGATRQSKPVRYGVMETTAPASRVSVEPPKPWPQPTTDGAKPECKYPGVRVEVFHMQKCIVRVACLKPTHCVRDVYDLVKHKVTEHTGYSNFVLVNSADRLPMDGGCYLGKNNIKAFVMRR